MKKKREKTIKIHSNNLVEIQPKTFLELISNIKSVFTFFYGSGLAKSQPLPLVDS